MTTGFSNITRAFQRHDDCQRCAGATPVQSQTVYIYSRTGKRHIRKWEYERSNRTRTLCGITL